MVCGGLQRKNFARAKDSQIVHEGFQNRSTFPRRRRHVSLVVGHTEREDESFKHRTEHRRTVVRTTECGIEKVVLRLKGTRMTTTRQDTFELFKVVARGRMRTLSSPKT